ncbi:MAG: DUF1476 domain-containing protein [Planctomycetes bacterium]|nr:DUF1476 domain-containing protein [Planctomycetota bacterium]
MSAFDERQKGFEAKFAVDQKQRFTVHARQTKLIGLWAAQKMRLPRREGEAYARMLVRLDVDKVGRDDVVEKVLLDLSNAGVPVTAADVRAEMERLLPKGG